MGKSDILPGDRLKRISPMSLEPARPEEVLDVGQHEEAPNLMDYWNLILKRRWTVLTSLLVVFLTVAIGTFKQAPTYSGTVMIELNPEPPNVLNFKEVLQIDNQDVDSFRETQFRILQSRTLAERVVRDLALYKNREFYTKTILFRLIDRTPAQSPAFDDNAPPDANSESFRGSVKQFQESVDISPVRRSNLVEISFYSHDPQLAARVANQLAKDYIDQNLQVKWDETFQASDWLRGLLVGQRSKLEKSEDQLQAYAQ